MCWNAESSLLIAGAGLAATVVLARRGEPAAVWGTIGYFTGMELLQAAGYLVINDCQNPMNRGITIASYVHIALQPLIINAFCMTISATPPSTRLRRRIYIFAAISTAIMLFRMVPVPALGPCRPGEIMCASQWCLVSGDWHIAWDMALNDFWGPFRALTGWATQFPLYMISVFILPLFYGMWRFVLFQAFAGPILTTLLTSNPSEQPAIWCLFSVGLLLIALHPTMRGFVGARAKVY